MLEVWEPNWRRLPSHEWIYHDKWDGLLAITLHEYAQWLGWR